MISRYPIIVMSVLFFCVLSLAVAASRTGAEESVPEITVPELKALMEKNPALLIYDVRTPEEYNEGHIKDATLIPLAELPGRYTEIPTNKKLVVYCLAGRRSAKAVAFLREHGYDQAVSLAGGYRAWSEAEPHESK